MFGQDEPILDEYCVEINGLSKSYGNQLVLNNVNMKLGSGGIYGILGRNGVGKTTLLECMIDLRPYKKGEVNILGESNIQKVKNKIGIQPQEANLFPRQTVMEILQLFGSFYQDSINIVELMDMLEMDKIKNKKVKDLSVGQRQRLLVSVALVGNPDFIILDEPTSGLDPQIRHLIWDCLQRMKEKGKTILLSTHYMEEAEKICDMLYILHDTSIVAEGSPKSIIQQHRKTYSDRLEDVFIHITGKNIRGEID
ncbi:ABC transporter ATP-binding protein [Pseudogracilibacillus sp. SO30301A]|uniref:ABC transporter ATP-binding protein n=1 Tax=Pseudogracilibacillus sp. SO30301A TaxID=3098291 RepID=UPI00300E659B